ncbi:MAG TPA: hypothetical protein VHV08_08450, partial [Pirellulales bacterium]|nr:hypothetical protein [Pirellulales bacterium]
MSLDPILERSSKTGVVPCFGVVWRGLFAAFLLAQSLFVGTVGRGDDANRPYGIEKRTAWTTSRLVGSPEPPLPYTVEKTFTRITWAAPMYVVAEPGTKCLLVVLRGGEPENPARVVSVACDPSASACDPFLEIPRRMIYAITFHP